MSDLGNREIIAENIRHYMALHGKSRNDMCQDLGLVYSTFSDWINGKKYPRIDKIEMMARYFGISKSDLVERHDDTKPGNSVSHSAVNIPVLGTIVAGYPMYAQENILDYEEISAQMAKTGEYFALQIKGQSMEPRIYEGDVVIVRRQDDVDSGDTAIVLINGDEATIKRVKKSKDGIMLIANNVAVYEPHFYSNHDVETLPVRIIGKVVELRGKL